MSKPETLRQGLAEILSLSLVRMTLSNPRGAAYKKITVRPMELRGGTVLQLEKFTDTQAFHENIPPEEAGDRLEALMADYGQLDAVCRGAVFCLKVSKKGKLFFQRRAAADAAPVPAAHNRQKQYLLAEGVAVPPLVDLGVLTPDGRVVKAKYDKFKQINRFLEFLDDLLAKDGRDTVRIIDFGCGKSYLTFIVYYYITEILRKKADITGLDLKKDVIDHCNQVARKYGYGGLQFFCGDIRDYYRSAGGEPDWSAPLEDGTLGGYAKDQALRSAALYATVEAWAEKYGCALTAEDRAAMDAEWAEKTAAAGGEEAYLTRQGLDRSAAETLSEDHYLYLRLCALAEEPNSPLWAGEEELAEFFRQQGYVTVDMVTFSGEDGKNRAAEAFAGLNASRSPEADFAALRTAAGGEDGYPRTLLPTDGTLPESLSASAAALAEGQLSGIVETEDGWAILLRLRDDTEAVRQDLLDHRLQAAADGAEVRTTEAYRNFDTAAFCAALDRSREALEK